MLLMLLRPLYVSRLQQALAYERYQYHIQPVLCNQHTHYNAVLYCTAQLTLTQCLVGTTLLTYQHAITSNNSNLGSVGW
jgi:hypothetical protein